MASKKNYTLEEEGGVTNISLRNVEKLFKCHGKIRCIEHSTYGDDTTTFYFQDGTKFQASGFAVGYIGEGAAGLETVIRKYLDRNIPITTLFHWERDKVYLILSGRGIGKAISVHPGVMDCEYDLEVW